MATIGARTSPLKRYGMPIQVPAYASRTDTLTLGDTENMVPTQDPIPPEVLPPGWGPAELGDDRFVYQHSNPPIELVADSTSAEQSYPGLGICRCWVLRYRYFLMDSTIVRSIGHVATRQAALDGLLECMRRIHAALSRADNSVAAGAILDDVCLSGPVPDGVSPASPSSHRRS